MKWILTQSSLASRGFLAVAVLAFLSCFSIVASGDEVDILGMRLLFQDGYSGSVPVDGVTKTNTRKEGARTYYPSSNDKSGGFEKVYLHIIGGVLYSSSAYMGYPFVRVYYKLDFIPSSGFTSDSEFLLLGYLWNTRGGSKMTWELDEAMEGFQTGISISYEQFQALERVSFYIESVTFDVDSYVDNYTSMGFTCSVYVNVKKVGDSVHDEEITSILDAVADIRDDVSGMSSSFDDIHSDLGTLSEVMSENHASLLNRIDLVGDSIVEQLEDVNGALNSSLGSVTQRVNYVAQQTYSINQKLNTTNADIASIKSSASNIDSAVASMEDYTEDIANSVDGINTGVDGLNDGVASMNTALSSINSGIGSLNTNISGLNGQLSGINSNVSDIEDFLKDGDGDYSFSERGYSDIVDSSEITSTMNGINSSMGIDSYNSKFSSVLGRVGSGGSTGLPFMDFNPEIGGNHIAFPTFEFASLGSPSALGTLLGCIKWLLVIAICWWLLIGTLNAFRA